MHSSWFHGGEPLETKSLAMNWRCHCLMYPTAMLAPLAVRRGALSKAVTEVQGVEIQAHFQVLLWGMGHSEAAPLSSI